MDKILEFETPDELIEFIRIQPRSIFKFSREYENIMTTNTFFSGHSIVIYWKGNVNYIHSTEEMIELYAKVDIKIIEDKTNIIYYPFKKVKKRKLTKREYNFYENTKDKDFKLFDAIMEDIESDKKFRKYLNEREKEKDKT